MPSVEQLTDKFSKAFTPEQASVLAQTFHDSYSDLVKTSDFNELKEIVRDLAHAQEHTEHNVEELAHAQTRTEQRLEELALAQARTEQKVEELAQAQTRTEQKVEELAQAQTRTEQKVEELAQAQKETQKELKYLARQVGGLSEAFGASLEDWALDLVPELLEKYWKIKIRECSRESLLLNGKNLEFDLVVRGSIKKEEILVLGEVKSNLTYKEADSFLKLVEKVSKTHKSQVRAIFFGYRASHEARELIRKKRAYMVFTHGKIM